MFDFERLFVCRELKVGEHGVEAVGIDFTHSAQADWLILFGYVLVPTGIGDVRYKLIIHSLDDGMDIVHRYGYRLHDARGSEPRIAPALIPVKSRLTPGYYRAILEFPGEIAESAGFKLI
jgi:hypothetical protein